MYNRNHPVYADNVPLRVRIVIIRFSKSSPNVPNSSSRGCITLPYESNRNELICDSEDNAESSDPVFCRMYSTATWENSTTASGIVVLLLLEDAGFVSVVAPEPELVCFVGGMLVDGVGVDAP